MTVSIEDIGPLSELVKIKTRDGEKEIEVGGVPAGDIFYLIRQFPEFKLIMERKLKDLTPDKLMKVGSRFIGTVIGFGTIDGDREEDAVMAAVKKRAAVIAKWPVGTQVKVLNAVFRCTFSDGIGPFVAELNAIKATFSGVVVGPSEQATVLPEISRAALQMDTSDKRYGAPILRAN